MSAWVDYLRHGKEPRVEDIADRTFDTSPSFIYDTKPLSQVTLEGGDLADASFTEATKNNASFSEATKNTSTFTETTKN